MNREQQLDFVARHYRFKKRAWFMERLSITDRQYNGLVRTLLDRGRVKRKSTRQRAKVSQVREVMAREIWAVSNGKDDRTLHDIAKAHGYACADTIRTSVIRYLRQVSEISLQEYIAQPTPEILPPPKKVEWELNLSRSALLACIPWTPDSLGRLFVGEVIA